MDKLFNLDSKFMQAMNKFADLMWLNVLTILCCIPIITIGPATTAMHYVLLKLYRNECSSVTRNFFKSFKENFRQSVILGLIYTLLAIVLVIDVYYMLNAENVHLIMEIVIIVAVVLSIFSFVWVFPLQCRYENKIKHTIKNSFMVGALNFTKSIMMMLVSLLPVLVLASTTSGIPIVFLLGLSVPGYVQAMLYSRVFDKMEGVERTADGEIIEDTWTVELDEGGEQVPLFDAWNAEKVIAEKAAAEQDATDKDSENLTDKE